LINLISNHYFAISPSTMPIGLKIAKLLKAVAASITARKRRTHHSISASAFTFAVLVVGLGYLVSRDFLLNLGIHPITKALFYSHQTKFRAPIIQFARDFVARNRKAMDNHSTICIDSS
jgi:hypothetical protein